MCPLIAHADTLPALLDQRALATPDARFVTFGEEAVTFAEATLRAERAAAALAALGVGRAHKVAVMLPNCLEFLDVWFGSALIGAVLVPINLGLKGAGLRDIITHCDASVLVADSSVVDTVEACLPRGVGPVHRLIRGRSRPGWQCLTSLATDCTGHVPRADVAPDHLASVLYTSGTTGLPKGVMNCHNAYLTAGREFSLNYAALRADDVLYTSLPLFHVNAQMLTTVGSLVSGCPMVLAPSFSASAFFADIRHHGATVFNYIGAMLTMLAKQPARPDDGDNPARLAIGGAAPPAVWERFERRFRLQILEIYGLTETATFCLANPPHHVRVGKLGRPVAWADVQVHRDDGSEAVADELGEIVIRSKVPNVLFQGYLGTPEATATAMRGGWFHSGDRGRKDADGYFTFVDRLKDCIRRRGENISSLQVEQVVNDHPAVAESAAIGVPSDLGEEDVAIIVVLQPGAVLDPPDLLAHCADRMAKFMVPRYVLSVAQLPKSATQRVQKFELRARGLEGAWDAARDM